MLKVLEHGLLDKIVSLVDFSFDDANVKDANANTRSTLRIQRGALKCIIAFCEDDVCLKVQTTLLSNVELFKGVVSSHRHLCETLEKGNSDEQLQNIFLCYSYFKLVSFSDGGKKNCSIALCTPVILACCMLLRRLLSFPGDPCAALVEAILEALLGFSQIEDLRPCFSYQIDNPPSLPVVTSNVKKQNTAASCVLKEVIAVVSSFPSNASVALGILMNTSLDAGGRSVIAREGGLEISLAGLQSKHDRGPKSGVEEGGVLAVRRAGLLSRICTVDTVQSKLVEPATYRVLCKSLASASPPLNNSQQWQWLAEERNYVIRVLASISKPDEECRRIAYEENLVRWLLQILPNPRTELGEITPVSVSLTPVEAMPPILIGNTARCLLAYADDAKHAQLIFKDRSLSGIEKLICAMASCSDIRVRKNIAIILAKGCRIDGVREIVTHFRGMQMLIELQDKL